MGLFILLGVLTVLAFVFAWLGDKCDYFSVSAISWVIGVCSGVALVVCLCCLPTLQSRFDYTKEQYYNLKAQVEYVESDMILNDANLRNQVLEMNNKISSHKIYSKNWFIEMFYSEEIGNLPRLQWKNELNLNN